MNNENNHPNFPPYPFSNPRTSNINNKLATLLAVIISFQQKIEILRVKLCGHPDFSPELYFKQIDRSDKGYIDTEDFVTFIKKSKPSFNIDHRYLKLLYARLNQDNKVPIERLTYFGYLNIIKPYFNNELARDLLLRDTIATNKEINIVTKKLLEDLICTLYVCVAEHERAKELIVLGDIEEGGMQNGSLYNTYQILQIIKKEGQTQNRPQSQTIPNARQGQNRAVNNINFLQQSRHSHQFEMYKSNSNVFNKYSQQSILDNIFNFISKNSQYEITREEMKYLLAYLMCHQYMVVNEKYLTWLFMPICASIEVPAKMNIDANLYENFNANTNIRQKISSSNNDITEINFLGFVHPNSLSKQDLARRRIPVPPKNQNKSNAMQQSQNPSLIRNHPKYTANRKEQSVIIDVQPRILINGEQNTIQTPILEKFLRESKVLKNMSRYRPQILEQSQYNDQSSAFTQGEHVNPLPQNNFLSKNYLNPSIATQHKQKPINKDFNLQEILNNSNLQRSQYYQNLSMRAYVKDEPLRPAQIKSPRRNIDYDTENGGILNDFLLK